MIGDLHCHTRLSDGSMSIDDLIFYAKRSGLDFVGVTDHDTMAGLSRAEQLGKRLGIGVIGGVEMSTRDYARGRRVHLLCYLPKKPDRLEGMLRHTLESRDRAARESMQQIMRLFPVTEEHILRYAAGSGALYSVHIMNALADLGYTSEIYGDLYQQLLAKGGSCYRPHEYPDVWEAATLIRSAGGICVLAHPSTYNSIELMRELAEGGVIDGVERYHPRVKQEDIPAIDAVVREYGLIATGGTDFHGSNTSHPNPLGSCLTMQESLQRIFKLSKSR